jgi:hypothetical protein
MVSGKSLYQDGIEPLVCHPSKRMLLTIPCRKPVAHMLVSRLTVE